MHCIICRKESQQFFKAKILDKYEIKYYYCLECGFINTEKPYWLDEAYKNPINKTDTGILSRNINLSRITSLIIYFNYYKKGVFLDYAGGHGTFTRLMRDIGFDFFWQDLYVKNLFANGFEFDKINKKIELITAFEVFEHFIDPLEELEKMLLISKNILLTTILLPEPVPEIKNWWYYGTEHGQHISFYSKKTLEFLAKKYNLNLYTNGINLHLLTDKKIKYFKILSRMERLGLFYLIKRKIKSKTFSDMDYIIKSDK